MALRRTSSTTTRKTEVVVKSEKQTPKKSPERIAKEAKYNADLDVYNKSKADQSAAESEYTSSMGKYNDNMKTYKESKGGDIPMVPGDWGKSLDKSQLARWNAANELYSPGGLSSASVRVGKGIDTEGFIKSAEKQQKTERLVGAYLTKYNQPVAPTKRKTTSVSEPVQDWDEEILPMKVTSISTKNNPKLRRAKEKEEFVGPEKVMQVNKKVSMNPGARGTRTEGAKGRYVGQVAEAAGSKIKNTFSNPNRRYEKEEKGFKSLYGGGATIGNKGFSDMSIDEMRNYKKEVKGASRRGIYDKGESKEALGELRSAIGFVKAERKGKNEFFESSNKGFNSSEGMGKRYMESSTYETDRKSSMDNATNRNKTFGRLQGTSEGASNSPATQSIRSQQKAKFAAANPTATPGQIRRGARDQQKADELLMKKVDKKIIK
tara:strand:- start:1270 stop:2571 length:1302 start_codon:yes stop_codon:yes gene_type:complete